MIRIEAPEQPAPKGGLLSVVTAQNNINSYAYRAGADVIASIIGSKPRPVPTDGSEKEFERATVTPNHYDPITVYAGMKTAMMNDKSDMEETLKGIIEGGATQVLETYLQTELLNPKAAENVFTMTSNPRLAVGLLEQWAGENLGTLPLIHGNRLAVSMMRDLEGSPESLMTKQGSPVANGSGYLAVGPGAAEAVEGEAWIYVSQMPVIYKSEVRTYEAPEMKQNDYFILSEVQFLPVLEGPVAAIRLKG